MLCPNCNTQNRDNAKFCKVCGYSFIAHGANAGSAPNAQAGSVQSTADAQSISSTSVASINEVAPTPTASINEGVSAPTHVDDGASTIAAENGAQTATPSLDSTSDAEMIEVVVPSATDVATTDTANPVEQGGQPQELPDDDISLAPTQILSPREMAAFQARRWQQEASQASQTSNGGASEGPEENESVPHPEADAQAMPAASLQQAQGTQTTTQTNGQTDISDVPTVMQTQEGDAVEGEPVQIAPPPPPDDQFDAPKGNPHVSAFAEQAPPDSVQPLATQDTQSTQSASSAPATATEGAEQPSASPVLTAEKNESAGSESETAMDTQNNVTPQDGEATPTQEAAADGLAVGTLVAGRYEVVQLVHADEMEHVYQVVDHQGYQHCWNCGSEQNAEGEEFCIDCGAQLLDAHYLMHEYGTNTSHDHDASVLQGTIVNTFVDNGKTYAIEQQHAAQLAFPNGVHLLSASDSDAGNVRRSEPNEDSTLVLQLQRVHESLATPVGIYIVADGMGGHDNGQGASRMAINVIADKMMHELLLPPLDKEKSDGLKASITPPGEDALVGMFKGAIEDANNVLVQTNQQDKTDMGSTITGFMIADDSAFIINVGDSRTYILRDNTLYQLTNDHSLVAQLVAGGLIEPDDVYTHPQRSQIFRSLGDKMNVQVDDFKQQLLPGDILLSCSDGLWEMVRNPQITEILSGANDPQTACTQLIEAANTNGGEDNVSAVVVFIR